MKKLTVGSCFSGVGGIELGLEWTGGFRTVWQCENDEYASRVLAKHWPNAKRYGDIRDVVRPEPVDLICGGFPCQDVSLAGKRAGLEGKRTTLWSEMFRLVCEVKPRWVVVENVPGLLSSDDGRFFGNILRDLAGAGYDAEWGVLSAVGVGAPHLRRRVFILAHSTSGKSWIKTQRKGREDSRRGSKEIVVANAAPLLGETIERNEPNRDYERFENVADPSCKLFDGSRGEGDGRPEPTNGGWWEFEPDVGRVASRFSPKLDGGGLGEQMDDQKKNAKARRFAWEILRGMWINREFTATPSELRNGRIPNFMRALPYKSGPTRWNPPNEENKELFDLWQRVSSIPFKEAQHLLPGLLKRIGEAQRDEAMAPWIREPNIQRVAKGVKNRVNRLRCLGNSVVPQVAQKIGEMILRCEPDYKPE